MLQLSEKIIFNGRELGQSVPSSHVLDVIVGAIESIHTTQERPAAAGSLFARMRDGIRQVSISVELPLNKEAAMLSYSQLRAWAASPEPARLVLPGRTPGYLMAVLTSMSELSIKQYYNPVDLVFTAYEPYFIGVERTAQVGASFAVRGDVETDFKITRTLANALSNPSWLIDGQRSISIVGTVPVGILVIDTATGNVSVSGQSIKRQVNLASRFYPLEPGPHIITSTSGGTISWSERWR